MNRKGFLNIAVAAILVIIIGAGVYLFLRNIYNAPMVRNSSSINTIANSSSGVVINTNAASTSIVYTSSTISMDLVQLDADPGYYQAATAVAMACRQVAPLVEVKIIALPALETHYYFRADCGPGTQEIYIDPGGRPQTRSLSSDSRQPISLSAWKISAQKAIQISGLIIQQVEAYLDLLQQSSTLVWDITQGGTYTKEIKVNATTGDIISKKIQQSNCGAPGLCE
jgi:hypothetical protein